VSNPTFSPDVNARGHQFDGGQEDGQDAVVAEKLFIRAERLQVAQDASGLSNEALGHRLRN
jgi:hypothetical protein